MEMIMCKVHVIHTLSSNSITINQSSYYDYDDVEEKLVTLTR